MMNTDRRQRRLASDDGSIVFVLLASIVLAGIVVILYGQVRTSERTSRLDQEFHQAIHFADSGGQAAFTFLLANEQLAFDRMDADGVVSSADFPEFTSEVGEGDFEWQAFWRGERQWEIRASGTSHGVTRYVEYGTRPLPLFGAALYGEEIVGGQYVGNFAGGNMPGWATGDFATGTGAYDGSTGEIDQESDIVAGTGANCALAGPSSGEFVQTIFVDETTDEEVSGCEDRAAARNYPDIAARAFEEGGICRVGGTNVVGDSLTGLGSPNYPSGLPAGQLVGNTATLARGSIYCFESMTWPSGHELRLGSGDGSVRVYVRGPLVVQGNGVAGRKVINVDNVDGPPDAASLQLMFAYGDNPINITHQNHVWVAAAIYAPRRSCEVNTQTKLWGAMICNTFTIGQSGGVGGFNFWWDSNVSSIFSDDDTVLGEYREEFAQSTGFDWVDLD